MHRRYTGFCAGRAEKQSGGATSVSTMSESLAELSPKAADEKPPDEVPPDEVPPDEEVPPQEEDAPAALPEEEVLPQQEMEVLPAASSSC